ncbi:hypothetical protein MP638_007062 [Amoeboaphelidium occidentale]|nr:hypothetical protein MP638_007062 [Amoeboaphelidium occidentale]
MSSRPPNLTNRADTQMESMRHMERQNDDEVNLLSNQVGTLKSLALQINTEVEDQNRFLGGMSQDFGRTQNALSSTMNRLQKMMKTQNGKYTCYMIIFIIFVFMVLYFMIKTSK